MTEHLFLPDRASVATEFANLFHFFIEAESLEFLHSINTTALLHVRLHQDGKKSPRTKSIEQEEEMANGHSDASQIATANLSNLCPCAGST